MAKKFDLDAYKKTVIAAPVEKKQDQYIVLDECLQEVIGIPGIPLGHITQIYGKSDTGKTSLLFHAAAQAQKQNVLPVFIMTEGKVDWGRAEDMGVDLNNCIINEECQNLEEVFAAIDRVVSDVGMGELPMDTVILWDSLGSLPSKDEVVVNKDGTTEKKPSMMRAAKVIREYMRVLSKKINNTRNVSFPRAVGLVVLNQAYTKPPESYGGHSSLVPYGGDAVWYAASAVWEMKKRGKLEATKDGQKLKFALVSKLSVQKNHITSVNMSGDFVITGDAFLPNEPKAIKQYKDTHRDKWGSADIFESESGEVVDE